jgi:hypothetical protein
MFILEVALNDMLAQQDLQEGVVITQLMEVVDLEQTKQGEI